MSEWTTVIKPTSSLLNLNLKELWKYRDLLVMFIKRDIVTVYKQTILGPIWFFVQPLLLMGVFAILGSIGGISTDGIPPPLFYIAGIVVWNYFSESFNTTSDTFMANSNIFGKVYFPRMIVPLSKVISALIKFLIQFLLFLAFWGYFLVTSDAVKPNAYAALLPLLVILMGGLGLGVGLIFTSLTAKYRDFKFLTIFLVQLLMYVSPVIWPASEMSQDWMRKISFFNPFSHVLEAFKYGFLGEGQLNLLGLLYASGLMIFLLIVGMLVFNKTEKTFMDTV
jgi:lipopolysaccharide transport system permease protein